MSSNQLWSLVDEPSTNTNTSSTQPEGNVGGFSLTSALTPKDNDSAIELIFKYFEFSLNSPVLDTYEELEKNKTYLVQLKEQNNYNSNTMEKVGKKLRNISELEDIKNKEIDDLIEIEQILINFKKIMETL